MKQVSGCVDWNQLVQDKGQWQALVNEITNLLTP